MKSIDTWEVGSIYQPILDYLVYLEGTPHMPRGRHITDPDDLFMCLDHKYENESHAWQIVKLIQLRTNRVITQPAKAEHFRKIA